jgi:hypothetical protein
MATIATLTSGESGASSLADINANFSALNTQLTSGANPGHAHTVASISASGVPSSSTFLRGDGYWASPGAGPMTTLGDTTYGGAGGALTRLAGDVTNSRVFLLEQSISAVAQAPVWSSIQVGDLPTVTAAKGGTGNTSLTAHGVLVGAGTSSVNSPSPGSAGQVLTSNGASADPSFQSVNLLLSGVPNVSISNSNTLTPIASVTVPANTLGTSNGIRGRFYISQLQDTSGVSANLNITLIYGATTVATLTLTTPPSPWSPGSQQGHFDFLLLANNSTSSQTGSIDAVVGGGANTGSNIKNWIDATTGTAAEDSTAAKTLAVKMQWSAASAGRIFTVNHFVIDTIH